MSADCRLTGRKPGFGNSVSRSQRRTRRATAVMKRGYRVALCGAAIGVTGLVGCAGGGHEKPKTAASTLAAEASTMAEATTVAAQGKVAIDDRNENLQGSCFTPADGSGVNISLTGATTRINVALDRARPPNVSSVVLVTGEVALGYQSGKQGVAHATQYGNTYNITGTATGLDEAAGRIMNSSFQITVACS